jgi:hypothetical protein
MLKPGKMNRQPGAEYGLKEEAHDGQSCTEHAGLSIST